MKKHYARNYIDRMEIARYDVSDFMVDLFCLHFSECEDNREYREIMQESGNDFLKFCAAYAQLKTNLYLGYSNDEPYDIKGFLQLSKDEYDYYVVILSPRLAHFVKRACSR